MEVWGAYKDCREQLSVTRLFPRKLRAESPKTLLPRNMVK